jgi:spore coat polysaccharide biosynthesis protein SpsF (cytidylyltransferase family)
MPKVVAIIQARLGSNRLPGKSLVDVNGKPLIAHVVERVRRMRLADVVVAAIPVSDTDLLRVLLDLYVDTFQGSESDVLSRYVCAAHLHQADIVVRVTGDCPMWDAGVGDSVVGEMLTNPSCDFASNDTLVSGWPDGTDVEVFSRALLDKAVAADDVTDHDREHVTPWLQRKAREKILVRRRLDDWSTVKLSVDTAEDLERVRELLRNGSNGSRIPAP